jgi:hypothetical protein
LEKDAGQCAKGISWISIGWLLKGTVSPDVAFYFRFCEIKLVSWNIDSETARRKMCTISIFTEAIQK